MDTEMIENAIMSLEDALAILREILENIEKEISQQLNTSI